MSWELCTYHLSILPGATFSSCGVKSIELIEQWFIWMGSFTRNGRESFSRKLGVGRPVCAATSKGKPFSHCFEVAVGENLACNSHFCQKGVVQFLLTSSWRRAKAETFRATHSRSHSDPEKWVCSFEHCSYIFCGTILYLFDDDRFFSTKRKAWSTHINPC